MKSIWYNPKYNTWTIRTILKAVSGVLFAIALWRPLLVFTGSAMSWYSEVSLLYATLGLIVFAWYYSFERARRRADSNWVF